MNPCFKCSLSKPNATVELLPATASVLTIISSPSRVSIYQHEMAVSYLF